MTQKQKRLLAITASLLGTVACLAYAVATKSGILVALILATVIINLAAAFPKSRLPILAVLGAGLIWLIASFR